MTQTVTYTYNVWNRLVGETVSVPGQAAQNTVFVYDGQNVVLQFDQTSPLPLGEGQGEGLTASDFSHRYLWGPAVDQLLADEQLSPLPPGEGQGEGYNLSAPGTVVWPLTDAQGTVRDLPVYNSTTNTTIDRQPPRLRFLWQSGHLTDQRGGGIVSFGYTGQMYDQVHRPVITTVLSLVRPGNGRFLESGSVRIFPVWRHGSLSLR